MFNMFRASSAANTSLSAGGEGDLLTGGHGEAPTMPGLKYSRPGGGHVSKRHALPPQHQRTGPYKNVPACRSIANDLGQAHGLQLRGLPWACQGIAASGPSRRVTATGQVHARK